MKVIHWDTIDDVTGTIWDDGPSDDSLVLSQLFPDIQDMFTVKPVERKKGGGAGGGGAPAKPKEVIFIEGKRSQNMAIAVSRFNKIGFENVCRPSPFHAAIPCSPGCLCLIYLPHTLILSYSHILTPSHYHIYTPIIHVVGSALA